MTSIDSGVRGFGADAKDEAERETERLRAEVAHWRKKYEAARKRDIA